MNNTYGLAGAQNTVPQEKDGLISQLNRLSSRTTAIASKLKHLNSRMRGPVPEPNEKAVAASAILSTDYVGFQAGRIQENLDTIEEEIVTMYDFLGA